MDDTSRKTPLSSSFGKTADAMPVQDALVILAIRLVGSGIRRDPSLRQHIIALARSTPVFLSEDYATTEGRINRFAAWAGKAAMNDLFARALDILRGGHRQEALAWAALNAVAQQPADEMSAMLHHIGKALGFTAAEVEVSLKRALSHAADGTIALK